MSLIAAIVVLVAVGAIVVAFLGTDAGDSCCSGVTIILLLIGIGAMALFMLVIMALFGVACTALL